MAAPTYSRLDRLQLRAAELYASAVMAPMPRREAFDQWQMTVTGVRDLGPHLRRITFASPRFADWRPLGPDECFALVVPPAGRELVLPPVDRVNVRQALAAVPEADRPDLRWYTVRAHRPDHAGAAEIDVDLVLHGDEGPASRWAARAEVGQVVGFREGTPGYRAPGDGPQLLVADETAMPALGAILETLDPETRSGHDRVRAYVEVPDASYVGGLPADAAVTVVERGAADPGSVVRGRLLADGAVEGLAYAWLCGESGLATGLRRMLVKDHGLDRRRVFFSGYWKRGSVRL